MTKLYSAVFAGIFCFISLTAYGQSDEAVKTISSLDVPRYLGTWYEIAKFPNWFQKKCVGNTKAVYSVRPDGNLKVLNSCKTADGSMSDAEGTAHASLAQKTPLSWRYALHPHGFLSCPWCGGITE